LEGGREAGAEFVRWPLVPAGDACPSAGTSTNSIVIGSKGSATAVAPSVSAEGDPECVLAVDAASRRRLSGLGERATHTNTAVAAMNATPPTTMFRRQLGTKGGGGFDTGVSAVIVSAASRLGDDARMRSFVPMPDRRWSVGSMKSVSALGDELTEPIPERDGLEWRIDTAGPMDGLEAVPWPRRTRTILAIELAASAGRTGARVVTSSATSA
jgi:hypothetical protein